MRLQLRHVAIFKGLSDSICKNVLALSKVNCKWNKTLRKLFARVETKINSELVRK